MKLGPVLLVCRVAHWDRDGAVMSEELADRQTTAGNVKGETFGGSVCVLLQPNVPLM